MATISQARKPLPLWVGLYGWIVEAILFLGIYGNAGDTTTRGWFATGSVAAELWGVLLIASPELRPLVERAISAVARWTRKLVGLVWDRISRLFRIRRVHRAAFDAAVNVSGSLEARVIRGHNPPSPDAGIDEKVEYLMREDERLLGLISDLENQTRDELEELRGAIKGTAQELREHTATAVREVAETELRMRLLGVVFVVVGLVLAYAANIA
jgi:hypothetical protein